MGELNNANLITKPAVSKIEECEVVVHLWNCGIKECKLGCGNLGVKIPLCKIELMRWIGLNEFEEGQ